MRSQYLDSEPESPMGRTVTNASAKRLMVLGEIASLTDEMGSW